LGSRERPNARKSTKVYNPAGDQSGVNIEFVDPAEIPNEPEDVRFRDTQFKLLSDGRRVSLTIEIDPFTQPPDIDIVAHTPDGREIASTAIIGAPNPKMNLTLHLKGKAIDGPITLKFTMKYQDLGVVDQSVVELRGTNAD
jgi:hypothetical protein